MAEQKTRCRIVVIMVFPVSFSWRAPRVHPRQGRMHGEGVMLTKRVPSAQIIPSHRDGLTSQHPLLAPPAYRPRSL